LKDHEFDSILREMEEIGDRLRREKREARKGQRVRALEGIMLLVDETREGSVDMEDVERLATGLDAGSKPRGVWGGDKLLAELEPISIGNQVLGDSFLHHLEKQLPLDPALFEQNLTALKASAERVSERRRRDHEARLRGMDPIERNTHVCSERSREADRDVSISLRVCEDAFQDLQKAIERCKAGGERERAAYRTAAVRRSERETKDTEEEQAQHALVVATGEQEVAIHETGMAREDDDRKDALEKEAVKQTVVATEASKKATKAYRGATAECVEADETEAQRREEVRRLEELLRLARLALEEAERIARLKRELELEREKEALLNAVLQARRQEEQSVAEEEHRVASALLKMKRSVEAEKHRIRDFRDATLQEAIELLRQAWETEKKANEVAAEATRALLALQFETVCAEVGDDAAKFHKWTAEDLKEVRAEEQGSADAWWAAEEARMLAEKAAIAAAAAEEDYRMWDLRHRFENDEVHGAHNQPIAVAGPGNFSPRPWQNDQDTQDIKEDKKQIAEAAQQKANLLREEYYRLLAISKECHEKARERGRRHEGEKYERDQAQKERVRGRGKHIDEPAPCRWREMYVDPLRVQYPELPPLAGTTDYAAANWAADEVDRKQRMAEAARRREEEEQRVREASRRREEVQHAARLREEERQEAQDSEASRARNATREEEQYRLDRLADVFHRFDIDGEGFVCANELQELGEARRTLGHKRGAWTKAQNDKLMRKIDKDGDGEIELEEFTSYFHEALVKDRIEFDTVVEEFGEVADECAIKKHPKSCRQASMELVDFVLHEILTLMAEKRDILARQPEILSSLHHALGRSAFTMFGEWLRTDKEQSTQPSFEPELEHAVVVYLEGPGVTLFNEMTERLKIELKAAQQRKEEALRRKHEDEEARLAAEEEALIAQANSDAMALKQKRDDSRVREEEVSAKRDRADSDRLYRAEAKVEAQLAAHHTAEGDDTTAALALFESADRNQDNLLSHSELKNLLKSKPWCQPLLDQPGFHWQDHFASAGFSEERMNQQEFVQYYNTVLKPLVEGAAASTGGSLMAACDAFERPAAWSANLTKLNELTEANHHGDHDRVSQLEVDISMDPLGADLLLYTEVFTGLDTKKESRIGAEVIERRFGVVVTSKGLANIINKKSIEAQLKGLPLHVATPFDLDSFLVLMAVCQGRAAAT